MYGWLESAIGAFIGFIGALIIAYQKIKLDKNSENTEQFYKLIALMYEIKRNIKRCEFLLGEKMEKGKISFSTILSLTYKSHWSKIKLSQLHIDVYINIERIYHLFGFVVYNIEKANVLETDITKKIVDETHTQRSIIHDYRYNVAIAFIIEYLRSAYKLYNNTHPHVLDYAKKNKIEISEKIIEDLDKYTLPHVMEQIMKYKLNNNNLD